MPLALFGNKFSPKKTPERKSLSLSNLNLDAEQSNIEFGLECDNINVRLGQHEVSFEDGHWVSEGGGSGVSHKELTKMKKQNQQLIEENNLLKVKIEILLDMLSETTAESHLQENEIAELKAMVKSGKSGKKR